MDCREAQEQILDPAAANTPGLAAHLSSCEACRSFAQKQARLDAELTAAIPPPSLSKSFRKSLMKKVRREPLSVWPAFLPDVAHLVGCAIAIAVCLVMLPLPAGSVTLGGLAFTIVTYVAQSIIRGSIEAWEEDGQ